MTTTAWIITVLYSLAVIVGVSVALIIFRSTRVGFRINVATRETLERRESTWGIVAVVLLCVLLLATIFEIPYWPDKSDAKQRLAITGRQFAWTIQPARAKAGVRTLFTVQAKDVNHAVGLYDPDDRMIKQVNVLPGVTQEFTMTLDKAGTYTVRCLEYCGVDHHLMANKLQVVR